MKISVINFNELRQFDTTDAFIVNTTSRADTKWERSLSPFYLGPVDTYGNGMWIAENVENAWQYSKAYPEHVNSETNTPSGDRDWETEIMSVPT